MCGDTEHDPTDRITAADSQQFGVLLWPNSTERSVGGFVVLLPICVLQGKSPLRGIDAKWLLRKSFVKSCE